METDKLELDPRILVKNLEITKLSQQVDSLRTQLIDLAEDKSQPNLLVQENMDLKEKLNEFKLNPSDIRFKDEPFKTSSQFGDLLIQENIDLKAEVIRLKDVIRQLSDPLRR